MASLCVHTHVPRQFAGRTYFDAVKRVELSVAFGAHSGLDSSLPVSVDVELPHGISVPWWFRAYVCVTGHTACLDGPTPRVTLREFRGPPYRLIVGEIRCDRWELDLPWLPTVPLESVCGKLPLHFVVRQGLAEHCRFVLQRRQHCTRLAH